MKIKSSKSWVFAALLLTILLCAAASYVNRPLPAYIDQPSEQEEISEVELPWELSIYEVKTILSSIHQNGRKLLKTETFPSLTATALT